MDRPGRESVENEQDALRAARSWSPMDARKSILPNDRLLLLTGLPYEDCAIMRHGVIPLLFELIDGRTAKSRTQARVLILNRGQ